MTQAAEIPVELKLSFEKPSGSRIEFQKAIEDGIKEFPNNRFCKKIEDGEVTLEEYHRLLLMIFHQTFHGPSFLALAGAQIGDSKKYVKDYLVKHAYEEQTHWKWVLDDLRNTNYQGTPPQNQFPPEPCQAYISFNFFVAINKPICRLAIALMLESLGARVGLKYAKKMCELLKLDKSQASFFLSHSHTDVEHTEELWEIIGNCDLTPEEWGWMTYASTTACLMYQRMFDSVAA